MSCQPRVHLLPRFPPGCVTDRRDTVVEVPPPPRRCAARRMATFPSAPLLLALEALAATSKGLPAPARFASALLPRAQVWGGAGGWVGGLVGGLPA